MLVHATFLLVGSGAEVEYKPLPSGPNGSTEKDTQKKEVIILYSSLVSSYGQGDFQFSYLIMWILQVTILENVHWKELGLLVFVWVSFLALQIAKVCSLIISTAKK